jgi:hypothetical protein
MTSIRNALSVNPTTCKISIWKTNKIQQRRSRIPNPKLECVFEIPKNPPNSYPMWRTWESLKGHTQAHDERNARPCHRLVQEEPIMLLYSLWSTSSPSLSVPSEVAVLIGVDTSLSSAMLHFLIRSSCPWLDVRRYLASFAWLEYLRKRLVLSSWISKTHSLSFPKS